MPDSARPWVLVTGGAGRIGQLMAKTLAERQNLLLLDCRQPSPPLPLPLVQADITQFDTIHAHFRGIDTVVHLAANPSPNATWDSLLPPNIMGLYNVFQAASEAGCRRVIFASSLFAVLGYPLSVQVNAGMPVRPTTLYGVTKAWGESLASFYAQQQGLSVICIRIGWLTAHNSPHMIPANPHLSLVITPRDLTHLIECCLEVEDNLQFGIFHGLSNNRHKQFDIEEARRLLNYQPQDDAFALARRNYYGILRHRVSQVWRYTRKKFRRDQKG